jgi:preprotein translocase subunit SecD
MRDLKTRTAIFFGVIVVAVLLIAPTVFPSAFGPGWISRPLSLGLDLKGGVHLLYEVVTKEAIKSRLVSAGNSIRSDLRNDNVSIKKVGINDKGDLEFTLLSERQIDKVRARAEQNPDLVFVDQVNDGTAVKLQYHYPEATAKRIESEAVTQAIETLRNRVDRFGVAEPLLQRVGDNRILLQLPGASKVEEAKKVVESVAKLEFRFTAIDDSSGAVEIPSREGGMTKVEDPPAMTGEVVQSARVEPRDGRIHVSLSFTGEGARMFGELTSQHVGRQLAIILDNKVYSAPVIQEPIWGGTADISGRFTPEEARELAVVLRSGALPAPMNSIEERTVGPTLGAESIRNGVIAIVSGFVVIALFMLAYYKKSGAIAVMTLAIHLMLVMGMLAMFGTTLTLPGLAGLALTSGMAVDSNVIIFERIKDELRIGASRSAAVEQGFSKALSAIVDSNLTSLITGIILYWFGTGPIRGFAVTLVIGIATTIYCATFMSRLMFDKFELKSTRQALSI